MQLQENKDFLTTQIITYLGNKRSLLSHIEHEVELISQKLKKEKLVCADLFSGSGIVARMLKSHAEKLIVNDLENYSAMINSCYLSNKSDYPKEKCEKIRNIMEEKCQNEKISGIISENYAPQDDKNILKGERVFYTRENALLIDTYRQLIDEVLEDEKLKKYFDDNIPENQWDPKFLQWYRRKGVFGEVILHLILKKKSKSLFF